VNPKKVWENLFLLVLIMAAKAQSLPETAEEKPQNIKSLNADQSFLGEGVFFVNQELRLLSGWRDIFLKHPPPSRSLYPNEEDRSRTLEFLSWQWDHYIRNLLFFGPSAVYSPQEYLESNHQQSERPPQPSNTNTPIPEELNFRGNISFYSALGLDEFSSSGLRLDLMGVKFYGPYILGFYADITLLMQSDPEIYSGGITLGLRTNLNWVIEPYLGIGLTGNPFASEPAAEDGLDNDKDQEIDEEGERKNFFALSGIKFEAGFV